jgi:hypothetical protein
MIDNKNMNKIVLNKNMNKIVHNKNMNKIVHNRSKGNNKGMPITKLPNSEQSSYGKVKTH